jgi:histidinol-phosphate phosphatase family protein
MATLCRCVFFDRDGVVNRSPGPGYVERWEDFVLLDDFVAALRIVARHGAVAVVVTNQRCVARGIVPAAEIERIHANLRAELQTRYGLALLDVRVCPHDDGQCVCRKPQPGMLLDAARRHGIDLPASWMVGDGERDVEAGHRAGCRALRVCAPDAVTAAEVRIASTADMADALDRLLGAAARDTAPLRSG